MYANYMSVKEIKKKDKVFIGNQIQECAVVSALVKGATPARRSRVLVSPSRPCLSCTVFIVASTRAHRCMLLSGLEILSAHQGGNVLPGALWTVSA